MPLEVADEIWSSRTIERKLPIIKYIHNMKKIVLLALCMVITACIPEPTMHMVLESDNPQQSSRFSICRVDVFKDSIAYRGLRGVYIIVDKQTGKEYVGISGVGIAERGGNKNDIER